MAFDIQEIEKKLDRAEAGSIQVKAKIVSGVQFKELSEIFDYAKLMAISGPAVPSYLRGEPGRCLAIISRALRWDFDPFFVAEKSYLVNNRGEEKIAFEAQLIHAIVESHAPIKGRLRCRYQGEGDQRTCIVFATPLHEVDALEYESPSLGALKAARGTNQDGKLKGSPLYLSDPDQQLFYYSSRAWCRRYYPDVLGGVYAKEEMDDERGPDRARDVTPSSKLADRLKARAKRTTDRGFDHAHVERETGAMSGRSAVIEASPPPESNTTTPPQGGEPDGHQNAETHAPDAVGQPIEAAPEAPPEPPAPEPTEAAPEPTPPPSADAEEQARQRGREARQANVQRRALPGELREPGREAEAAAWRLGWDEAGPQQTLV